MKAMKIPLLIAAITLLWFTACNYTPEGEWWYRHQGSETLGAHVGAVGPIIPLGGDRGLGAEPPGGPLEANDPSPKYTKDEATEGLRDPRWGVSDATGAGATSLSSSDAGSSKFPPPGGTTYVDITPASFPFVTTVPDNGTGKGGGWQEANVKLEFKKIRIPTTVITWWCPFNIGMPLRTEFMGRVDVTRAASFSVEITQAVAATMDYDLPQGIFCTQFVDSVRMAFRAKYFLLGVRVKN